MKRFSGFLGLIALCAACNSTPKPAEEEKGLLPTNLVNNPSTASGKTGDISKLPRITIPDSTYDFGKLSEGETVVHEFAFSNTGGSPLIISGAESSCGCTVPDYPREPVAPGKGGVLKVEFHTAGKMGHQEKTVTVSSNSSTGAKQIVITADVAKTK